MSIKIIENEIEKKILLIRGLQVMLDRDLAVLYGVETRALKQAIKRNRERFPETFMFELAEEEVDMLVSQTVIPSKKFFGGALPYAFTEQGVSMLSAVLKSKTALEMSIKIINSFVQMRTFLSKNAGIFQRLERLEERQKFTDQKLDTVLNAIEDKSIQPKQGIFFDGQIFDAYLFASNLIRSAKKSIVLIDNYVDESVLTLLSKREPGAIATLYTKTISKQLQLDLTKHNEQYAPIEIQILKEAHDRFLIVDGVQVYHIGASLKDLGKKWFAFSKFDIAASKLLDKLA